MCFGKPNPKQPTQETFLEAGGEARVKCSDLWEELVGGQSLCVLSLWKVNHPEVSGFGLFELSEWATISGCSGEPWVTTKSFLRSSDFKCTLQVSAGTSLFWFVKWQSLRRWRPQRVRFNAWHCTGWWRMSAAPGRWSREAVGTLWLLFKALAH